MCSTTIVKIKVMNRIHELIVSLVENLTESHTLKAAIVAITTSSVKTLTLYSVIRTILRCIEGLIP